ncbi:MAG: DUF4097 domain-containing protein [Clostridiales bacterium]|jgi:DUF4097 and DUF4098 domain-containing protein YvlB|nr:DUF4097 domain-containing protein [Clostridiales bacterium]
MQSEKMMILKMLEEGKINADEASRLLAAGEDRGQRSEVRAAPPPVRPPASGGVPASQRVPGAPTESAIDSMGRKIGAFVKEMEPKVKKVAGVVVEKTASAAESISKSLSGRASAEKPMAYSAGQTAGYAAPKAKAAAGGIEDVVEIKVEQPGGELNLTGLNGQVLVKGYNGDKISAKIYTVAKRAGARVSLATLGNKYYLSFDENDFERVCIDAFVPESMFDNIKVATVNGDLSLSTVSANFVFVENIGGSTEVVGVNARQLSVESNNGVLSLKDTTAERGHVENFNGPININKIDIADLKATTFNGGIDMQIAAFAAYDSYKWYVETSNGKLFVVLPTYATLGYHIKAHAALDAVKLGLVSMNYLRNDRSFVEAKSANFDSSLKQVEMELATSNAPLIIN